jgi:hypothetical protein
MRDPDFTVLDGPNDRRKAHLVAGDPPGEYEGRYVSRSSSQLSPWKSGS